MKYLGVVLDSELSFAFPVRHFPVRHFPVLQIPVLQIQLSRYQRKPNNRQWLDNIKQWSGRNIDDY